ncbi:MAG TPA: c-type cytochrome, partial [Planctomycetaceae bacterium]|nr:c-type cytochrome [Planctomycetaceae bacterium]
RQLEPAMRKKSEQYFANIRESATAKNGFGGLGLLAYDDFDRGRETLAAALSPQVPPNVRVVAIRALANFTQPEATQLVIDAWNGFGPETRPVAAEMLLQTAPRAAALLAALDEGTVKRTELDRAQKQFLLNHPNDQVRATARKLLADDAAGDRPRVGAAYQSALTVEGNAERGRMLFQKHCAACHQVGQTGHVVGPNLASVSNKSAGDLLISVLDPNREALPTFNSYTLVTTQGKILTGIVAAESATSVTLKRAEGQQDVVLRSEIEQLASNGISLMPEGFEKEITPAQLADLIEFIRTLPKTP